MAEFFSSPRIKGWFLNPGREKLRQHIYKRFCWQIRGQRITVLPRRSYLDKRKRALAGK